MRCPQASFEAQPRFARLLAPKMGIGPYMALLKNIPATPHTAPSRGGVIFPLKNAPEA